MTLKKLALAGLLALGLSQPAAMAQDLTGEIVTLHWFGGTELATLQKLQEAFVAQNPGVSFRDIIPSGTGDPRGGLRTVLMGGEPVDLIINTWPAFRAELAEAGLIQPIDDVWAQNGWDEKLNESWKALGQTDGVTYGVQYNWGDRSGWFYLNSTLEKAGVTPPKTWDEFLASIPKFKEAGITPLALPAKSFAHGEIFETLLLRVAGADFAAQLSRHEVPWTSPEVRQAMLKFKELIDAGAFPDAETALGTEWDNATDNTLKSGTTAYVHMFGYAAVYAADNFGIKPGDDFNLVQFPAMGLGFDDTSSVESKEFLLSANGANPEAAKAFLDFALSAEAANIYAADGFGVPSSAVDTALYGAIIQTASEAVSNAKLQFVLGDTLPGDVVDEYRVQLQKFIQNPTEATIDEVLAAIEAKAQEVY